MMDDEITAGPNRRLYRRTARPNTLTTAKRERFLDVLAATANVRRAAIAADADTTAFYRLRSRDAGFAESWQRALDDALVRLESDILARALGEDDAIVGDGERAGEAGRLDVRLGMDVLKRRDAQAAHGAKRAAVMQRRQIPIEEVERELLRRLDAIARKAGRA